MDSFTSSIVQGFLNLAHRAPLFPMYRISNSYAGEGDHTSSLVSIKLSLGRQVCS